MSVVRVVFLGTPEIARHCLEQLLKDEHFKVVGVVTQPDRPAGRRLQLQPSPVKQLALKEGIPVITPEKVRDPSALQKISQWGAEAAVVVAFGQILPQEFLDLYPKRVVNVHASLLPRWRGAAPIQRAIMEGDTETGVALQVMVKKLDAGDVVGFRKISVTDDMDAVDLHDRMKILAADLLSVDFMDYLRGNLAATPQDETLVTYAPKIEKSESEVDWKLTAREIHNRRRGLALGPGVFTFRDGRKLKILQTEVWSGALFQGCTPGEIVKVELDSFVVACGHGTGLVIRSVQPESKGKQTASEYLRGHPMTVGELLK